MKFKTTKSILTFLMIMVWMANFNLANAQCTLSQLGIDIDGESTFNLSGTSVSLSSDGSVVAIGAPYNPGGGTYRGHVRVYKNISGTWTQQGSDIDGESNNDNSGWSVSLSSDGSTLAIGAPFNSGGGSRRGHVRIYKNIGGTWTQQGSDIDGESNNDNSGWSVSLSSDGSIVAIGATSNAGGGSSRGHTRVYKYNSGTWTQQGADIDGEANSDQSGYSVSLSSDGSIVAIGAPYNNGGGSQRGHLRVYKNISGTWTQQGADIDGEANSDQSGYSVSISSDGNTVAIGAPNNAAGGSNRGHVRLYKNNSGTWIQEGADIDGSLNNEFSGKSISISSDGKTIAVGAYNNSSIGTSRGQVKVYKNISGTWVQQGSNINGEANGDQFGFFVSLSSDSKIVAIGAPYNGGGSSTSGHVRVYELTCPAPEINIKGNNLSIVDGDVTPSLTDSTNLGSIAQNGTIKRRFRIINTGNDTLRINSIVSNNSEFTISNAPTKIKPNDSALFTVSFSSANIGVRNSTITINNNDADEAVYDFAINAESLCTGTLSYTQLGTDINGNVSLDQAGTSVSVSADGSTIALGAPFGGSANGQVRIYKNISGTWTQQGSDISGESSNDWSGLSVSLSSDGSTVAIGAPRNAAGGSMRGHVRVYKNISGTWTQIGLDIDGETDGEQSGYSVSLSSDGSILAIGAPYNAGGGIARGRVRVFKNISGTWVQQGANINGEADINYCGISVSLSSDGSVLAIGANGNAGGGSNRGHVRVYKIISGTWTQQGADIDGEADNDFSGIVSISSDGSTVAIGAASNSGGGTSRGHVRVYKNISGTWTQQGADIDGEANYNYSGQSVSISADGLIVAIGAPGNAAGGSVFAARGHARVFKNISGSWTQQGTDIDGEADDDNLGRSVSLSSDGGILVVGAPYTDANGSNSGYVRAYKLNCLNCNMSANLPKVAGTYTSTQSGTDGTYTCYCDGNFNLLLALDLTSTGAVIPNNGVSLQIGSTKTTTWNNAGGIITNPNGGVIFNRKWNVTPTTQPSSPVKVKFFFTQEEYDSVRVKLSSLGTTISSPTQFEMYKLFTGSFGDPHASGSTGIILMNGSTPSLNNWKYAASGSNHSAEFLVSSFSGGGGGGGAGAIPLPLEFINFIAKGISNTSALLKWQTVSEVNTNFFEVERSIDGVNFIKIGTVNASGTNSGNYQYIDNTISIGTAKAFYRIKQIDVNGTIKSTNVQVVNFGQSISTINVYPNPFNETLNVELDLQEGETANITITDAMGKVVYNSNTGQTNATINVKALGSGLYNITIHNNNQTQSFKIMKQ